MGCLAIFEIIYFVFTHFFFFSSIQLKQLDVAVGTRDSSFSSQHVATASRQHVRNSAGCWGHTVRTFPVSGGAGVVAVQLRVLVAAVNAVIVPVTAEDTLEPSPHFQ